MNALFAVTVLFLAFLGLCFTILAVVDYWHEYTRPSLLKLAALRCIAVPFVTLALLLYFATAILLGPLYLYQEGWRGLLDVPCLVVQHLRDAYWIAWYDPQGLLSK